MLRPPTPETPDRESTSEPGSGRGGSPAWAFGGLAILALVVSGVLAVSRPPSPLGTDAPAERFSGGRALELARTLDGGPSHAAGTPAHAELARAIAAELERLGLTPETSVDFARAPQGKSASVRNVLARVAGSGDGEALLLVAPYDSVGSSPGAGDRLAPVAVLLEVARALTLGPPLPRAVILLFADGSQADGAGSAAFVEHHPLAPEVGFAIALQGVGNAGGAVLFETSAPGAPLVRALARHLPRPSATSAAELVYTALPSATELAVLRGHGVPGVGFAFPGGRTVRATPLDGLERLDAASVQHLGDCTLALARGLGAAAELPAGGPAAGFTDVGGRALLWWPRGLLLPLAAGALLLALVLLVRALRGGALDLGAATLGAVLAAAAPVAVLAWGLALSGLLATLRATADPARAHPAAARLALVLGGLALVVLLCGSRAGARASARGVWLAGLAGWALASVGAAAVAPDGAHLFLLPVVVALLAAVGCRVARPCTSPAGVRLAVGIGLVAIAIVWTPLARALEQGFGVATVPRAAAPTAVLLGALAPVAVELRGRVGRLAALGLALAALVAVGVALLLPTRSPAHPGWLNLRYVANADLGTARWEASTYGAPLPDALRAVAGFGRATAAPFPWLSLDRSLYVAPAPPWDVPPPSFEVLAIEPEGAGRRIHGRLSSPRGAARLHLHLPPGVELASAATEVRRVAGYAPSAGHIFVAIEPALGLEVELVAPDRDPVEIWVLDQDWALPPGADDLRAARPADAVPAFDGDVSILGRSVRVE